MPIQTDRRVMVLTPDVDQIGVDAYMEEHSTAYFELRTTRWIAHSAGIGVESPQIAWPIGIYGMVAPQNLRKVDTVVTHEGEALELDGPHIALMGARAEYNFPHDKYIEDISPLGLVLVRFADISDNDGAGHIAVSYQEPPFETV